MLTTTQQPQTFFDAVCAQLFSLEHRIKINEMYDNLTRHENAEILFARHPELINIFRQLETTEDKSVWENILIALKKAWQTDIYNEVISLAIFKSKIKEGTYKITTEQLEKIVAHAYTHKSHESLSKITAEKFNNELDDFPILDYNNKTFATASRIIFNLLNQED
jgi:hypothetical protein